MRLPILLLALASASAQAQHALRFTEAEDRVTVPHTQALNITGAYTLEVWLKIENTRPEQFFRYILSKNYGGMGYGLVFGLDYAPAKDHVDGRWFHFAEINDAKTRTLMIDGKVIATGPGGFPNPGELPLWIGCSPFVGLPGNQPTTWTGSVDEVRIWGKARKPAEVVRTMKRRLRGDELGLLAYYPFDEGKGQAAIDHTGHTAPAQLGYGWDADKADPEWSAGVRLAAPLKWLPKQP
jgi:hypothetical protein